jgi:hypothetical protein
LYRKILRWLVCSRVVCLESSLDARWWGSCGGAHHTHSARRSLSFVVQVADFEMRCSKYDDRLERLYTVISGLRCCLDMPILAASAVHKAGWGRRGHRGRTLSQSILNPIADSINKAWRGCCRGRTFPSFLLVRFQAFFFSPRHLSQHTSDFNSQKRREKETAKSPLDASSSLTMCCN